MNKIVLMLSVLLALSFISIAAMFFVLTTRTKVPGKKQIGFLFLASFIYTLGYALELGSNTESYKLLFNHLQYFGIELIAPLWLMISIQYNNRNQKWKAIKVLPIFIIPCITVIMNLTFRRNGLYYSSYQLIEIGCYNVLQFKKGYWYYIGSAYKNIIGLMTIVFYYFNFKKTIGVEKKQSIMLLILSIIGLFVIMSCFINPYTDYIDSGVFIINMSTILLLIVLVKHELLDLMPIAYYNVFEFSDNPILILSSSLRYVKSNAMAKTVFGDILKDKTNMYLADIFNGESCFVESLIKSREYIISKAVNGEHVYYSVRLIELDTKKMKWTKDFGYLLMFTNETTHINTVHNLESEASMDVLTGLFNRRYFYKHAEQIINKARDEFKYTSVVMLDVDRFKNINDRYGHQIGDYILREISGDIKSQLRDCDLSGRYGGEEFIILLSNTDKEEAKAISERICASIRNKQYTYCDYAIRVTISAGVSMFEPLINTTLDECINIADRALYKAKENGRDRVHVA